MTDTATPELDRLFGRLKARFGDPLPKYMHLSCGWGGPELAPDGRCPKCNDLHPWSGPDEEFEDFL